MSRRITIMIDEDIHSRLRKIQADRLKKSNGTVSFSRVINDELRKRK